MLFVLNVSLLCDDLSHIVVLMGLCTHIRMYTHTHTHTHTHRWTPGDWTDDTDQVGVEILYYSVFLGYSLSLVGVEVSE